MLDHSRLQELFLAACDLPEDEQRALVDAQCEDDPALRQELQLLLRTDARKGGIFADDKTTDGIQFHFDTVVESELPQQIGQYQVKEVLGEGGMGVVYLAEQQNPRRDVAVKVIRSGMVSPDLLKRFELEAAVLGRLAHPGIANIYEAGVFVDGATGQERPFLAMEYVEGQPLREFVQQSDLGTRDRLQLFVQICEAVHHAHQRGVIHRDLKPGNVLVKDDGQASILDFGVARATGMDPGMSTLQTRAGQLIGTLPYMSPEQVTGHSLDVDTRSDVYSLGVIAYELLSGKLPYDVEDAEYLKAAKAISEDLPTPLSSVRRELRGDLNTVVLKALEKEPDRRYQSAKELGDDVQRYLNGQPILAMPIGPAARAWKWCQRNTVVAALLSLLALAIVLGFAGITKQTFNALNAKQLAEDSEQGTERVLELLIRSFRSPDPTIDGRDVKMVDVLIKAASDLEEDSEEDPLIKARLMNAIGESFQSLGIYDQGVRVHTSALAIRMRELGEEHPDTMSSMANLGALTFLSGDFKEGLRLFIRSTDLRTKVLGEEHADTLKSMNDLAVGYHANGKPDEALELMKRTYQIMKRTLGPANLDTLKVQTNIARHLATRGDHDQALPILEEAIQLQKQSLGDRHPLTIKSLGELAEVYGAIRPAQEALPLYLENVAQHREVLGDDHPQTLDSILEAAGIHLDCNNEQESIRLLEKALPTFHIKLGDKHPQTITCISTLGQAYLRANRPEDALTLLEEVDQLTSAAGWSQARKANGMWHLAQALLQAGQKEKGVKLLKETLQFLLEQGNDDPAAYASAGHSYLSAGMYAEAELHLHEAVDQLRESAEPGNWGQFVAQAALGESLAQQGKHDEAEPLLLSGCRGLLAVADEPPYPTPRQVADALRRIIRFYELTEQPDQAREWQKIIDEM